MRLQLDLPEERVKELKALMEETGAETYKELFNNALTIFEWAVNEIKSGNSIAAINEEKEVYRVLVTPLLERVAKRSQAPVAAAR